MRHLAREYQVPANHPAFHGHFPANPVVPAATLLTLVVELASELGFSAAGNRWRRIKFLRPVGPDELFGIRIEIDQHKLSFRIETPAGLPVAQGQCGHVPLA